MTKRFILALLLQASFCAARNEEFLGSKCTEDADDLSMLQTKSEKVDAIAELHQETRKTRQELKEAHEKIGLLEAELKADEVQEQEAEEGDEAKWGAMTRRRRR